MNSNYLVITQLLLEWAIKMQEASTILQKAALENRDVTDEEVTASKIRRDVQLEILKAITKDA